MMKSWLLLLWLGISPAVAAQSVGLQHLLCDYQENPIGIDAPQPALSWQLQGKGTGIRQTAYRILVADNPRALEKNKGLLWDSRKVLSDQSLQVRYHGPALQPATTYYWKVMVWDQQGNPSAWSETARWHTGLLTPGDWQAAQWIGYEKMPDAARIVPAITNDNDPRYKDRNDVLPLLRKTFDIRKPLQKATVYISGLGQFDLHLNGKKTGDHFLDPGWTKYDQHALYVTFDVTEQLQTGRNALGVMLGNGFFYIPGSRYRKLTSAFGYPQLICRLHLQYKDGSTENIVSDSSWKTAAGPITFSSIYGGEDYNATLEQPGWDQPSFDDAAWKNAVAVNGPPQLNAQTAAPLKIFDRFTPVKITQTGPATWVYDMGQNASAIPAISLKGKKGTVVKITPAELLTDKGMADQSAVGSPVYFNYTLKGDSIESWQPQFMYYGFRYIQVDGAAPAGTHNGLPEIQSMYSLHTRNAAATIGQFSCSNELFNKTFRLIDWAIRSNTASVLTDCPHREKLGWLEEAHLVGSSIRYNYDIAALCRKVVRDMIHAQTETGLIPDIAPEYVHFDDGFRDSPEWGSNGIILPWYMYQWYGDKSVLEESYPMMIRYVNYLEQKSNHHILSHGLGDWYDIGPKFPGEAQLTPKGITATAMYYYDLSILSKVATLLGKTADAQKYYALSEAVKQSYNRTFFNDSSKQYATGSQTANAMSVYMQLTDSVYKGDVVENIVADIRAHNNGITAGDIGYRYLLRVLDDEGRSDVIFDMNSRSDVPGYGLQLAKGATALTESWQGYRDASNNHFMLGHLMEWFYSGLAGIRPAPNSVAFQYMVIRPEPVGDVTFAKASYISPYGEIISDWKKEDNVFTLKVRIPGNTHATIYVPAESTSDITLNGVAVPVEKGYKSGRYVMETGSGEYVLRVINREPVTTSSGSYAYQKK
ncbi:Alpha-L-rhamnosidase N-terminal domain-containing protein [Chitinophaga arvensicola]|uniref:alpha-L-rhamnosidase n=2 Tax=Chitinophaga arvensicola TaxID=29529 RepID=A0A1I0SB84_9BACT|nr:Alpha-L-rhamnosidase N-terminal domain-containing protein [Chitinophaga arvensicola]